MREFLKHLLFVEQPLHRDAALQANVGELFARWPNRPPTIIDESDGTLASLPVALSRGYVGTSHKNCKGVFKGIGNRCLLAQKERDNPGAKWIMSGEDLGSIGPVAVIQDLAVASTLGVHSVERNGHHYFPGLSMFSKEIQQQVLAAHPGLYKPSAAGWPMLDIQEGILDVASLTSTPWDRFIGREKFTPVDRFQPA